MEAVLIRALMQMVQPIPLFIAGQKTGTSPMIATRKAKYQTFIQTKNNRAYMDYKGGK